MVEHLEGLHDETFKQWIDKVHEKLKEQVETDSENNIYSDSDSE
jgi:single-stranded DNA-specific DHH superfamily exonuclease